MFSNKRIKALEDRISVLEHRVEVREIAIMELKGDIRRLSHITSVYIRDDISSECFSYDVPVNDILVELLYLHGLNIAREPATRERFTLVKREEDAA